MVKNPLVTVLMPVYNSSKYLREAVDSILEQTFTDFEFLIIDDGSTDNSWNIFNSYNDKRINLIQNSGNLGLTFSLNHGLEMARGKYIARMDADDISLPDRLEKQVAFMEANPSIGVCGTWVQFIGAKSGSTWRYATDDATIKCQLLFQCALAHPSVMLRSQLFKALKLRYELKGAEDYDLWVRASKYMQLANIPVVLLKYRVHHAQKNRLELINGNMKIFSKDIYLKLLTNLSIDPTREELLIHDIIATGQSVENKEMLLQVSDWLHKLNAFNLSQKVYSAPILSHISGQYWYQACSNSGQGLWAWQKFWQSPLSKSAGLDWQQILRLAVKCAIRWHPQTSF